MGDSTHFIIQSNDAISSFRLNHLGGGQKEGLVKHAIRKALADFRGECNLEHVDYCYVPSVDVVRNVFGLGDIYPITRALALFQPLGRGRHLWHFGVILIFATR